MIHGSHHRRAPPAPLCPSQRGWVEVHRQGIWAHQVLRGERSASPASGGQGEARPGCYGEVGTTGCAGGEELSSGWSPPVRFGECAGQRKPERWAHSPGLLAQGLAHRPKHPQVSGAIPSQGHVIWAACAWTGNPTLTSRFIGRRSTTDPRRPG